MGYIQDTITLYSDIQKQKLRRDQSSDSTSLQENQDLLDVMELDFHRRMTLMASGITCKYCKYLFDYSHKHERNTTKCFEPKEDNDTVL